MSNNKKYKFKCNSCSAEYSISFEPIEDNIYGQDIICCPFCGDDCDRPEDGLEEEEDNEDIG
jgi:hypothetical protein|tara:strand:- start:7218 stop:7403 length:186 start_codon:yes stop_codon:yes gene_type:complete